MENLCLTVLVKLIILWVVLELESVAVAKSTRGMKQQKIMGTQLFQPLTGLHLVLSFGICCYGKIRLVGNCGWLSL